MARHRTQYRIVPYREKRKDRRVLIPPLRVALDGAEYETTNWSFGGFLLEDSAPAHAYGQAVAGSFGWDGRMFPFAGRVTRHVATTGELAVAFDGLAEDALVFLNAHLRDYLARPRAKA